MGIGTALINYLVEFYSVDEIKAFWKQAGDALVSRSTTVIHITGTSFEGQSSNGMALSTPQECQEFMAACEAAIARKSETTSLDPARLGTQVDFSRRAVQV